MAWVFAALAAVGVVEILGRTPFFTAFHSYRKIVGKVFATMRSRRVSDHWKERVLPRYALSMMACTLMVVASLLAAFVPFLILWALAEALSIPFMALVLSWSGILAMTGVAVAWMTLRKSLAR